MDIRNTYKWKAQLKVMQFHYRPGHSCDGSRRLVLPDFKTIGT